MILMRSARRDDRWIYRLILDQLLPYSSSAQGGSPPPLSDIRRRLNRGVTYVIRTRPRTGSGFIHLLFRDGACWIDMLAVRPEDQGRGYGSTLLSAAKRVCVRRGLSGLSVFVDRINARAIQFYMKHGFMIAGYERLIDGYRMIWKRP